MQDRGKLIAVRPSRLLRRRRCRHRCGRAFLHRRRRRRCGLPQITQAAFEFLDSLPQSPFEFLRIRNTGFKPHAPVICFAQQPLKLGHMTAKPLDDRIGRLLKFFFQLLDRYGKIFVRLITTLTAMDDIADNEKQYGAENDERTQNFSDGNNNRSLPYPRVLYL